MTFRTDTPDRKPQASGRLVGSPKARKQPDEHGSHRGQRRKSADSVRCMGRITQTREDGRCHGERYCKRRKEFVRCVARYSFTSGARAVSQRGRFGVQYEDEFRADSFRGASDSDRVQPRTGLQRRLAKSVCCLDCRPGHACGLRIRDCSIGVQSPRKEAGPVARRLYNHPCVSRCVCLPDGKWFRGMRLAKILPLALELRRQRYALRVMPTPPGVSRVMAELPLSAERQPDIWCEWSDTLTATREKSSPCSDASGLVRRNCPNAGGTGVRQLADATVITQDALVRVLRRTQCQLWHSSARTGMASRTASSVSQWLQGLMSKAEKRVSSRSRRSPQNARITSESLCCMTKRGMLCRATERGACGDQTSRSSLPSAEFSAEVIVGKGGAHRPANLLRTGERSMILRLGAACLDATRRRARRALIEASIHCSTSSRSCLRTLEMLLRRDNVYDSKLICEHVTK